MNVQIIRGAEVNRPTPDPLSSSVLDHATVVTKSDFGLRNNEGLWPSYNCLDTLVPTPICPDPLTQQTKEFSVAEWIPAYEFAVYGGVQCKAVGLDAADQKAEVDRVFTASEGKGVERSLLANRFVATGSDVLVGWDAPVEVGGPGMSLQGALGSLIGYAAAVYAGQPTIHMSRAAVEVAFGLGLLTESGGKFYTKTGAKVAAGGGYDEEDPANYTGTFDLYATGEIYIERSDEINVQSWVLPGDGSNERGFEDNTVLALAERMYRVGVDCFVAHAAGVAWGA